MPHRGPVPVSLREQTWPQREVRILSLVVRNSPGKGMFPSGPQQLAFCVNSVLLGPLLSIVNQMSRGECRSLSNAPFSSLCFPRLKALL